MSRFAIALLLFFFAASWCATSTAQTADEPQASAVRAALAELGQAFNRRDAAGVAAAWTEDAIYVDLGTGELLAGREAIEGHYARLFTDEPQLQLTARLSGIELAGPSQAFVRGVAEVAGAEGEPSTTSFLAELSLVDGKWLLVSVEEDDPDPMNDLAWLVGDWQDEGDSLAVQSSIRWNSTGRFLIRTYSLQTADGQLRRGTQYIAWDANRQEMRSWAFSAEGAIAEGVLVPAEDHWAIHWTSTLADGRTASATQVLKPIDQDTFEVHWADIDVDGDLRPSTEPVTVRRVASTAGGDTNRE